jgi:poly(A) polymerase/tRNA nucleotidyltransferase (CCA-adding enzyme)
MKKIPQGALTIIKTLKKAGYECYLVGGGVRDALLNQPVSEWDLTTNATPPTVIKLFKKAVPTGIKYGTVTIILPDGKYEITTYRSDEKYSDGRHPDRVRFTQSLTEDLARRDFTVNAMAYDPELKQLVDPFSGKKDLKKKILRAVGNPIQRFKEDGLRPLRACRLAAKLNFKIEPQTARAISLALKITKKVAPERLHDELLKIMETNQPSIALELMRRTGLLKIVLPELLACCKVRQPRPFHLYDVYWHSLYSMDAVTKNKPLVRLAALLHDISKPECKKGLTFYNHHVKGEKKAEKILKRLKFSNAHIKKIMTLVRHHMFDYQNQWKDAAVRRFLRRVGTENVDELFDLRAADTAAMNQTVGLGYLKELRKRINQILKAEQAFKLSDLKINGHDVMQQLNISPGPRVGQVLDYLLEKVLDHPRLNTKARLWALVKQFKTKPAKR